MLFCKDYRDQVAAEVGSAAPNVVSKALGEKWAQTTDRHTWEQQAEKDKGADVPLRPSVPDGPPGIKNRRARPGRR